MAISLLVLFVMGGLLAWIVLVPNGRPVAEVVAYQGEQAKPEPSPKHRPMARARKPSAPSASTPRSIVADVASPVAIPTPTFESESLAPEFGSGNDFGDGDFGDGFGQAGGDGGGFGTTARIAGALTGRLYDFKQGRDRQPNRDYPTDPGAIQRGDAYVDYVTKLHRRDFSELAFAKYYRAPQELSLTHLAIPFSPASDGPRYFGAEKDMQPSGWMAHYSGELVVPEDGRYRFVGFADDYMAVFIDGRPRLIACWPDIQARIAGRWDAAGESGRWDSPIGGQKLVFGDWVRLRKGQEVRMDLGIGERPGGKVGFVLLIEKEGEAYRRAADGRPILPLFSTGPLPDPGRARVVADFPDFEFEWERVPYFSAR